MALSIPTIPPIDFETQTKVREQLRQLRQNHPSLGHLESVAIRLAGTGIRSNQNRFEQKRLIYLLGDYGHQAGNPAQTAAQIDKLAATPPLPVFRWGKAAGVETVTADIGRASGSSSPQQTIQGKTIQPLNVALVKDMAVEPALSLPEVQDAIWVGMNIASQEIANGMDLAIPVGVAAGGSLAAAAVSAVYTNTPIEDLVDERTAPPLSVGAIRELISKSFEHNKPDHQDPLDVLRCVGGADLCALVGVILVSAAGRVPILLDNFVTGAAALAASYLSPAVRSYLFAAAHHNDPGMGFVLSQFGLNPLVQLGFDSCFGEGSILAIPQLEAALNLFST